MRPAPLTPMPLGTLLARIAHEWDTRTRVFDLPTGRFWRPDDDVDLGFDFLGRRCATPIGPAAGPHSQLAENIVLAWLGGSRLFELKTVQVLDALEIARPCIDMETVGYNIEWSQELTVDQSIDEYVKAWMLIEILRRWEPLAEHLGPDPGPHVFDMSVGYDLAGISGPKVTRFIDAMRDASAVIERLRPGIGGPFAHLAEVEIPSRIADTLTLSTFHGCPPDEIDAITRHLVDTHDLDVIVKLNPTLLGYDTVAEIVNGALGYDDVAVRESAFAEDLRFDDGLELISGLRDFAHQRGRRFGVKLTNTLVVDNTRGHMPDDPMYLSGPPLHVLATTLLARLAGALPGTFAIPGHDGDVTVSFSAGVTKENIADTLATGVGPATVCSDLLKPGGYGRLAPMLRTLGDAVRAAGCTDLDGWCTQRQAQAEEAGHPSVVDGYVASLHDDPASGPYHRDANTKTPRQVDSDLEMFGCVACNLCVTVCPNDAFFSIPSLDTDHDGMEARQQYLLLAELCNDCGNCMTFCPERGDPAVIKPRLHLDREVFEARDGQGFLVDGHRVVDARADAASVDAVAALLRSGSPLAEAVAT